MPNEPKSATSRSKAATAKTATSKTTKSSTQAPAAEPVKRTRKTAAASAVSESVATAETAAPPAKPRRAPSRKAGTPPTQITAVDRLRHIEVAAYYIAAQRGFAPGDSEADWFAAEAQIDGLLLEGKLSE